MNRRTGVPDSLQTASTRQVDVPTAVLLLRNQLFNALTVVKEHNHYRDSGESCWGCYVEKAIRDTIAETARATSEAHHMQEASDG